MSQQPKSPKASRTGGAIKNIGLLLAVLALGAFTFEGMVRLVVDDGLSYELEMWKYARDVKQRDMRPEFGHRHAPDRAANLMRVDMRTNRLGIRGPDIAPTAAPGVARIAFVGDSTTLGWGVAEKETFAHQVVADLARQGRKVDGFNLGVGNYNVRQELSLFREVGVPLKPDIVVLTYFINDAEPLPAYGAQSWLDLNSAAWIVLRYRLDTLIRSFGERPDWKEYYRGLYRDDAAGWKDTQKALGEMIRASRDIGARIVVFHLPELRELSPYPFADVTDKVRKAVEAQGVPFVDMLPAVEKLDPASLWVTVPDPHPNGRANTAFTAVMTRELLPLLDELCRKERKGCKGE
ncbi:MAG: SGNH/GDSL hydrolase family protein [Enhydrobacter sp.]|nr:MAG: SGNH/GDSL hydrolase family protein [Enhydrobacter sp.]